MRRILAFTLVLMVMVAALAALNVSHAASAENDYIFDSSEIFDAKSWIKYGTAKLAENGQDKVVRFVPETTASNGYGITVDIPVDNANYMVVRYDSNLQANSFGIAYAKKSNFDFNYQYGVTKHKPYPSKKVAIFNMVPAVEAAKEAGETSIKYVKFLPWDGQAITPSESLSDVYFDVYSIAFFTDANQANAYAEELQSYSYVDYSKLPAADAFYSAKDLNNAFAWIKNGYRATISGAIDNPFKYVPDARASNGIGFKVDVPVAGANYAVVRYFTNVIEKTFRLAYSKDDAYDYNRQYGISSVTHTENGRIAVFNMSAAANAAKQAGETSIEYLKLLPWEGQTWTGDTSAISKNYFNVYSVAFFETEAEAEAYKTALEEALPPLEFDKSYNNTGIIAMPGVSADSTVLDNMEAAFKAKQASFTSGPNQLIIYPEYPEQIGRDYDYSVRVSQGGEWYTIPVYNELRQGGATRNPYGDMYRRFCEFAFKGEPVTVEITVNVDFSEYTIIPAAKGIASTVNGNVITFEVTEPTQLIFRLGNGLESNNTNLAIFADPPEENVPEKDETNKDLVYVEGWYSPESKKIELKKGQTLYIAPGAVCNARIEAEGDNITIMGRGMVRDPEDTRSNNVHGKNYVVNIKNGSNIRVDGIKIVDCRFYHLYMSGVKNAEIYNVKIFSNQISTDGFLLSGTNIYMHDSYADAGDDVFTGSGTNKLYDNMLVGSTCGIFSLSGARSNETYRNINIFRADEAIFKNYYGTGVFMGATFENIYAVDCPFTPFLFTSKDQGDGMKNFIFKNISINAPTGATDKNVPFNTYTGTMINIVDGGPFQFDFENFYIDGELVESSSSVIKNDHSSSGAVVNVTANSDTQGGIPKAPKTTVLAEAYDAPEKPVTKLHNGENIVPDGDFENGVAAWVCVDFSYIQHSDDAHSGEKALFIPASTDSSGADQRGGVTVYLTDAINRGGSGDYLVTFYAKKEAGHEGSDINAVLGYYYGDITETTSMTYKSPVKRCTLTEEWQKYSFVANIEVDEVQRAALSIHRGSGNTFLPLNFYIDDVSIVKLPVLLGDTSGDGSVGLVDIVVIARGLAGWDGYKEKVNLANSDFDSDFDVTTLDMITLSRHLANWKGYESLTPTA